MIICKTRVELNDALIDFRESKKQIGFVPTMGALHQGHISLISKAKQTCDIVVCSIFVNPTQFNDLMDLERYPRTIDKDILLLKTANCNIAFIPEVFEIYTREEIENKKKNIEDRSWTNGKPIDFGSLDKVMEGVHRPGHFNGVAQVVSKLFKIVNPHQAFFGQKDFQQVAIVKSMAKQLSLSVEIVVCEIVREENGLAMSSRNNLLSDKERIEAGKISQVLFEVKKNYKTRNIETIKVEVEKQLKSSTVLRLEYFEIANSTTLIPISEYNQSESVVACIAVMFGKVRLIDNIILY